MLRRFTIASILLIGASFVVSPVARANSDTVGGTVNAVNTVTFTGAGTAGAIDVAAGATDFVLGDIDIQNNDPDGWTLNVQSANGGKLMFNTNEITYTGLNIDAIAGATITPVNLAVANTDEEIITAAYDAAVAAGVSNVSVHADIAGSQHVPAGIYTDTLTFTITNK